MRKLKFSLMWIAHVLRLVSKLIEHWIIILIIVSLISPISPHVRITAPCTYIGTRGIVASDAPTCPLITIIDTRRDGGAWW